MSAVEPPVGLIFAEPSLEFAEEPNEEGPGAL
jgi:hypothetical protein